MGENERARFAKARAELKEDLELYRLLTAYQESSSLEEVDGLARMALAALADSACEYLKAGEGAGYADPEKAPNALPPPEPQRSDILVPISSEPSRLLRPQPAPPPGGMSTEDLMKLVEEDAGLIDKP